MDSTWVSIGLGGVGLLQAAGLWLASQALADRQEIIKELKALVEKVGIQNGRVGKLETWRDEHVKSSAERAARLDETDRTLSKRIDDTNGWDGPDRRRHPRR